MAGTFTKGLLTNPMLNVGLGILGRSGPSLTPNNPWMGIQDGILNMQRGEAIEKQNQYRDAQMAEQERKRKAHYMKVAEDAKQRQQRETYLSSLDPKERDMLLAGGTSALNKYIENQLTTPEVSEYVVHPETGQQKLVSPSEAAGLIESGWQKYEAPKSTATSAQNDYALAVEQGYTGSFLDYKKSMEAAGATKIDMGGTDRVTTSEAASMRYPDGTPVNPGELWEDARRNGAVIIPAEEKAAATKRGTTTAQIEQGAVEGAGLIKNYKDKFEEFQKGFSPYGANRGKAKEARDALVAWYAKNILGTPGAEPSPSLYDRAETAIPDYAGVYDRAVFEEKMEGLESTLSSKLGKEVGGASPTPPADGEAPPDPAKVGALLDRYDPK